MRIGAHSRLRAGRLLAKLRDLNFFERRFVVEGGTSVSIEGCLSLDSPALRGVRYLLRMPDGSERILAFGAAAGGLDVSLTGGGADVNRCLPLVGVTTESTRARDVERLFRRLAAAALKSATSSR